MGVNVFYGIIYFLTGLCAGSFVGLCADRMKNGVSICWPPSHCEACGRRLGPKDLVPVVSYLYRKGRCGYCRTPLSRDLLYQELGCGLLFLLLGWGQVPGWQLFTLWGIFGTLYLIVWQDLRERAVYHCVLLALAGWIALRCFLVGGTLLEGLFGVLAGGGFLLVFHLIFPQGLGFGDVLLCSLLGAWLGPLKGFQCIVLGNLLSLGWALSRAREKKLALEKVGVPLAPFLALGAFLVHCKGVVGTLPSALDPGLLLLGLLPLEQTLSWDNLRSRWEKLVSPWPKRLLVVHWGNQALTLTETERRGEKLHLARTAQLPWPRELPALTSPEQVPAVAEWLGDQCRKRGFGAGQVSFSLSSRQVLLRRASLPQAAAKNLAEAAQWGLLQDVPWKPGTFTAAAVPVQLKSNNTAVLLQSKALNQALLDLAAALDWELVSLEAQAASWGKWLTEEPGALLLTKEGKRFVLTVLQRGIPVDSEPLALAEKEKTGAEELTKSPLWQEAQGTFQESGQQAAQQIAAYAELWRQELGLAALPLYAALGGGEPLGQELQPLLQKRGLLRPLPGLDKVTVAEAYARGEELLSQPEILCSLGAAKPCLHTRKLSLHRTAGAQPSLGRLSQKRGFTLLWGLGFCGLVFCQLLRLGTAWRLGETRRHLAALAPWEAQWQTSLSRKADLEARSQLRQKVQQKQLPWAGLLALLGSLVPADCWVTRVTQEGDGEAVQAPGVVLEGRTLEKNSVLRLVDLLQHQPGISDAQLERLEEDGAKDRTAGFRIRLQLKGGGSYAG